MDREITRVTVGSLVSYVKSSFDLEVSGVLEHPFLAIIQRLSFVKVELGYLQSTTCLQKNRIKTFTF